MCSPVATSALFGGREQTKTQPGYAFLPHLGSISMQIYMQNSGLGKRLLEAARSSGEPGLAEKITDPKKGLLSSHFPGEILGNEGVPKSPHGLKLSLLKPVWLLSRYPEMLRRCTDTGPVTLKNPHVLEHTAFSVRKLVSKPAAWHVEDVAGQGWLRGQPCSSQLYGSLHPRLGTCFTILLVGLVFRVFGGRGGRGMLGKQVVISQVQVGNPCLSLHEPGFLAAES